METVLNRQYGTQLAPTAAMTTPHLPAPAAPPGSFVPQTAAMVAMNDYVASTQFGGGVEKYEASDSGKLGCCIGKCFCYFEVFMGTLLKN